MPSATRPQFGSAWYVSDELWKPKVPDNEHPGTVLVVPSNPALPFTIAFCSAHLDPTQIGAVEQFYCEPFKHGTYIYFRIRRSMVSAQLGRPLGQLGIEACRQLGERFSAFEITGSLEIVGIFNLDNTL